VAEYLASDEFKTIYDYLAKNNSLSVWFSREGYPVQAVLKSRIVPNGNGLGGIFGALTDTTNTTSSTSKKSNENQSQFVLETTFKLQDINKAILPKVPTEFLSFEEAWKLLMGGPLGKSLEEARGKANDVTIKTSLSGIQMVAKFYYDENKKTYGPGFASGPCPTGTSTIKNIFTDPDNKKIFEQIVTANSKTTDLRCASSDQSYAVAASLGTSGTYFCVDSSGEAREIKINDSSGTFLIVGKGTRASPYKCGVSLLVDP
jgi:hypothetical protein